MEPIVMTLLTISSVCGAITTIVGFSTLMFKKPKQLLKKWIDGICAEQIAKFKEECQEKINEILERLEKFEESEQTRLGHAIMTIYDRSTDRGYITLADRKDLVELHHSYKDYHGNHHVDEYYDIMMHMEIR